MRSRVPASWLRARGSHGRRGLAAGRCTDPPGAGAVILAGLTLATLAACGPVSSASAYSGGQLSDPVPLPAVSLTDTAGTSFELQQRGNGLLTVVYFGYTNCPDVCPTTMADLGNAVRKLPVSDRDKVQVVFITTDPQHDTPKLLRSWLNNFDAGVPRKFVGLSGDLPTVQGAAKQFGVVAQTPQTGAGGKITDTHGAQVIAFSPSDEKARVIWLPGTKVSDYTHDMSKLLST